MGSYFTQVEQTLARISGDVDSSRQITDNLRNILLLDALALDAIGDARNVRQVLDGMKSCPGFTQVSAKGLEKIRTIIRRDTGPYYSFIQAVAAANAYSFVAGGGLEIILSIMEAEDTTPDMLEHCSYLLGLFLSHSCILPPEFMRKELGRNRITQILIHTIIKTRKEEANVFHASFAALEVLGDYLEIRTTVMGRICVFQTPFIISRPRRSFLCRISSSHGE
jgi:hypothetical protein